MKYKKDFLAFSIVSGLFFVFLILCWGKFGDIIVDCGREAYLPQLILEGKILYKEIFAMYNPLSYQINALLYLIFGASFNTLYFAGIFTTYLILLVMYLISRQFLPPFKALLPAFVFICFCISKSPNCIEYVFPYSYGIIYAFISFLCFILFSILYVKKIEQNSTSACFYSLIASLLMGFSLAFRFEYVLAYIPFIIFLLIKVKNIKLLLLNILFLFLPIMFSFSVLFFQGFTFSDLVEYVQFGHKFFNTEEQKWYSKTQGYSFLAFFYFLKPVFHRVLLFFSILFLNILCFWGIQKLKLNKAGWIFICSVLFVFESILILSLKNSHMLISFPIFSWLTYSSLLIFLICLIKRDVTNRTIYILLSLFTILSAFRVGFVYIGEYSIYFLPVAVLLNLVFVLNLKMKPYIEKSVIFFLILVSCLNFLVFLYQRNYDRALLKTDKGNIYVLNSQFSPYSNVVNWIKENTNELNTILVLPESPMLNFITNRPTNNKYYHLIPNHISALGEENIVRDLIENMPDYIILQKYDYQLYGKHFLGLDYGLGIYEFINKNYVDIAIFSDSKNLFSMLLFKKKK